MPASAGVPHILETFERLLGYSLIVTAAAATAAGLFILLFRIPARTAIVTNGRTSAEKILLGSIIVNGVYTNGVKAASYMVDDVLAFSTHAGEEVLVSTRRRISKDPASLIWYAPENPRRFTTRNPLRCFGLAAACALSAIWLHP